MKPDTLLLPSIAFAVLVAAGCTSDTATPTATATSNATVAASASAVRTGTPVAGTAGMSPKDATYEVGGKQVTLVNGVSEVEAAPGSASKVTTKYFGNEASGDLNGDGQADLVFILTQSPGGSGTFYYAVAALRTSTGWTGTNAILLGDRVAPQSTAYQGGKVVVTYADRKPGEPMTTAPSVGVSKTLAVVNGKLVAE